MDIIGKEIHRLDRVVKALVDFNRPIEPRFHDFDLRRVVDDVTMLATPDAARSGVQIVNHASPDPLTVKADTDLVKQALLNIVLNGVQAMEQGGILKISTRHDESSGTIEVRDQGRGISPDIRDKVFNLFFTTKKEGSGIGLAISYRLMQLHGGSLSFESEPGAGTVFRMTLPLSRQAETVTKEHVTIT
jgi:signal transduction histidine kinase